MLKLKLITLLVAALPLVASCSSTGTPSLIAERYDVVKKAEFGWSPIGVPTVDGPIAGFVAYGTARQAIMIKMQDQLEFPIIDRFNSAVANELADMVADGEEATDKQKASASKAVKAQMTPEERAALGSQVNGFEVFAAEFVAEVAKAGVAAVAADLIKDLLKDPKTLGSAKALGMMQGMMAVKQMNGFMDQIAAANEIEGILTYLENTQDMFEAGGTDF